MYKSVKVDGFRGISSLEVQDFQQVNLLVGENNCGKTSILEALFVLSFPSARALLMANASRDLTKSEDSALRAIFHGAGEPGVVNLHAELYTIPENHRTASITPLLVGSLSVVQEPTDEVGSIDSAAFSELVGVKIETDVQFGDQHHKLVSEATREGDRIVYNESVVDVLWLMVKATFINPMRVTGLDKLVSKLQIAKRMGEIVAVLKKLEPSLVSIQAQRDGLVYCDVGLDRLLPINVMGDGMQRILAILSAIATTEDGVVFIDEVENGLYFRSQAILWEAVFEFAKQFNVQVFATTHSWECVKYFDAVYSQRSPAGFDIRVFRIERGADRYQAVTYDHEVLSAALEDNWEVR